MKRVIWKFPFGIRDETQVTVPISAEFRHVGLDPEGQACLWMEVAGTYLCALSEQKSRTVFLYIVGTGEQIPDAAKNHLGSFAERDFVWHIYTS